MAVSPQAGTEGGEQTQVEAARLQGRKHPHSSTQRWPPESGSPGRALPGPLVGGREGVGGFTCTASLSPTPLPLFLGTISLALPSKIQHTALPK